MRKLISEDMWDDEQHVFANKYPADAPNGETKKKGGFSKKISPTSFYPMMANASTDAQAEAMTVHWLTNKTRFCINENYETENEGRCYWGLPSISAYKTDDEVSAAPAVCQDDANILLLIKKQYELASVLLAVGAARAATIVSEAPLATSS
eukprot:SAG31_NODE_3024_length_4780_cov_2.631275_5_plen_151_part_00